MGLFRITIKSTRTSNGVSIEKGMSVDVISKYSNPITTNGSKEVQDAFLKNYGIDIKKCMGGSRSVLTSYSNLEKIN
ncbi:hypothetical protein AAU57_06795 [Nonlabens sp. YIK11]|uniref:DUF6140 family protein n=1 Tax=Nonlabens sp. YIK11 TaxID=1453349 RepID=UPI0006DC2CB8|nr:DUF6140 family protein [Nonlabens sp. YIK11]KQC33056.1 hypothetical protein AAU57_06795 [Nonlabens sp. YIK11]